MIYFSPLKKQSAALTWASVSFLLLFCFCLSCSREQDNNTQIQNQLYDIEDALRNLDQSEQIKQQLDEIQITLENLDARLEAIEKKLPVNDKQTQPVKKKPPSLKKKRHPRPSQKTDTKRGKSVPLYFTMDRPVQEVFFGQVVITLLDVRNERVPDDFENKDGDEIRKNMTYQAATFEITLPGDTSESKNPYLKVHRLEKVEVGTRRQFEYKQEIYFFDLLRITDRSLVEVSISKRRYGEPRKWWN